MRPVPRVRPLLTVLTVAGLWVGVADAQVVPVPRAPSAWKATMRTSDSADNGMCHLLIGRSADRAALFCRLADGAALQSFRFFVDGLGAAPHATVSTTSSSSPFRVRVDAPPGSVIDGLSRGRVRIEGHDASDVIVVGTFTDAHATWTEMSLDGFQVVPPAATTATGTCAVLTMVDPSFIGLDCSHELPDASTGAIFLGAAGETGTNVGTFALAPGDQHPVELVESAPQAIASMLNLPFYVQLGSGGDTIRGQKDCLTGPTRACLQDRFEVSVTAELVPGEPRVTGRPDTISDELGLFVLEGTDATGRAIRIVSGTTVYVRDDCESRDSYTLFVTLNTGGDATVTVRDTVNGDEHIFEIPSTVGVLGDAATLACAVPRAGQTF